MKGTKRLEEKGCRQLVGRLTTNGANKNDLVKATRGRGESLVPLLTLYEQRATAPSSRTALLQRNLFALTCCPMRITQVSKQLPLVFIEKRALGTLLVHACRTQLLKHNVRRFAKLIGEISDGVDGYRLIEPLFWQLPKNASESTADTHEQLAMRPQGIDVYRRKHVVNLFKFVKFVNTKCQHQEPLTAIKWKLDRFNPPHSRPAQRARHSRTPHHPGCR